MYHSKTYKGLPLFLLLPMEPIALLGPSPVDLLVLSSQPMSVRRVLRPNRIRGGGCGDLRCWQRSRSVQGLHGGLGREVAAEFLRRHVDPSRYGCPT